MKTTSKTTTTTSAKKENDANVCLRRVRLCWFLVFLINSFIRFYPIFVILVSMSFTENAVMRFSFQLQLRTVAAAEIDDSQRIIYLYNAHKENSISKFFSFSPSRRDAVEGKKTESCLLWNWVCVCKWRHTSYMCVASIFHNIFSILFPSCSTLTFHSQSVHTNFIFTFAQQLAGWLADWQLLKANDGTRTKHWQWPKITHTHSHEHIYTYLSGSGCG